MTTYVRSYKAIYQVRIVNKGSSEKTQ